jgi:hypothetical protein
MKILASFMIASLAGLAIAPASADQAVSRGLAIVAPAQKQALVASGGAVVISLAADPPLAEGEHIVVCIDDEQIVVLPSGVTQFAITDVTRGTHIVDAIVVDADAKPVAAAETIRFDVGVELRV